MTERRNYRQPRGRPCQLPYNFTDLRQVLNYKKHQRELEEGKPSNTPPPDPPSLLRDSLRGDDPPQTHRNDRIPNYSYGRRSRGSFRKRGGGNRFMQNESDKEEKGKFPMQYNIKVEVSTETGDRKCTIDNTETYNQNRNRGNHGRRNFRGSRRGRTSYRGQYFYRGQNKQHTNKDSNGQGSSNAGHFAKDVPLTRAPIQDAEEDWDNDDVYANNLNKDNNNKDNDQKNVYVEHEEEAEQYEEDYSDENADHSIENNDCVDYECEANTLSSNDGDYKDLDVDEESVVETSGTSNNTKEKAININNGAKDDSEDPEQQTNENQCSKQDTVSEKQLEKACGNLQQLTLEGETEPQNSGDICKMQSLNEDAVAPAKSPIQQTNKSELSKGDTTSDGHLNKDCGDLQQLILEGKPDIELKSADANNKTNFKEEKVANIAIRNTVEEEKKNDNK